MKVAVLVPSEEYKNYAGARIRYGRLRPELERLGIDLVLQDIGEFAPEKDRSDAILISKCHDARALVAAAAACEHTLVGVDLFDDYFSQVADSRLLRYRNWLTQLLPFCDFSLCSTPAMAEVVETYGDGLPIHVANDPAPEMNVAELPALLRSKLAHVRNGGTLQLGWFGVGDNPHFNVGLSDVAAYAGILASLGSAGMDVELTILTNARALTAEGLALVHQVPVRTRIEEWSEARERELLAKVFACFLPVNAQGFSAAKSLNRAVTGLSSGCQVISVGYPLYEVLDDLIYRDAAAFLGDVAAGSMKHSAQHIERYRSAIQAIASPDSEAKALANFLEGLNRPRRNQDAMLALVHGHATNGAAHKSVRASGGLSVGTPYCASPLGFDVLFRRAGSDLVMLVSDRAAKRVAPALRYRLKVSQAEPDGKFWIVPETENGEPAAATPQADSRAAPLPFQLACYGSTMSRISERVQEAFGPCRLLFSESSPLPFSVDC